MKCIRCISGILTINIFVLLLIDYSIVTWINPEQFYVGDLTLCIIYESFIAALFETLASRF